jgi:hypothetical protein
VLIDPFLRRTSHAGVGLELYIVQQIALTHGAGCIITWPRSPLGETPAR